MGKNARLSVRLEEEARAAVDAFAREERRSKSTVLRELLEEAIRMRRCPGIAFLEGPTGRRTVVAGTGLEVWEVVATYHACGQDFECLASIYDHCTPVQLRSALAYYQRYPEAIDREIQRQEDLTAAEAKTRYPHLFHPASRQQESQDA